MAVTPQQMAFAHKLGAMAPPARAQALSQHASNPAMHSHLTAIMTDPVAASVALGSSSSGGSAGAGPQQVGAGDPSGAYNPNRSVAFGASVSGQTKRRSDIRHQILGVAATTMASAGQNQLVKAKPQVSFKGIRFVLHPLTIALGVTLSQMLVGTTNQLAGNTQTPGDVFGPTSYAGDIDFSLCNPAIDISFYVNSGLAGTFWAGLIGLVKGKVIAPKHTKVQALGLTPQIIGSNSTVTFAYNPQLTFVPRKVALTPGTMYSDSLLITNVQCGQMLQTASSDPYPASLHSDLFPVDLDWDLISPAVGLQFTVQNTTNEQAVFQGIAYGDVDPNELARAATAYV